MGGFVILGGSFMYIVIGEFFLGGGDIELEDNINVSIKSLK